MPAQSSQSANAPILGTPNMESPVRIYYKLRIPRTLDLYLCLHAHIHTHAHTNSLTNLLSSSCRCFFRMDSCRARSLACLPAGVSQAACHEALNIAIKQQHASIATLLLPSHSKHSAPGMKVRLAGLRAPHPSAGHDREPHARKSCVSPKALSFVPSQKAFQRLHQRLHQPRSFF